MQPLALERQQDACRGSFAPHLMIVRASHDTLQRKRTHVHTLRVKKTCVYEQDVAFTSDLSRGRGDCVNLLPRRV
jgi:hypothetical protein